MYYGILILTLYELWYINVLLALGYNYEKREALVPRVLLTIVTVL